MCECMYDGLCMLVSMCVTNLCVLVLVTAAALQSRAIPTLQSLVYCLMNMTTHSIYVYIYLKI